jgi:hypothetical protein
MKNAKMTLYSVFAPAFLPSAGSFYIIRAEAGGAAKKVVNLPDKMASAVLMQMK